MSILIPYPNETIKQALGEINDLHFFDGKKFFQLNASVDKKKNDESLIDIKELNNINFHQIKKDLSDAFPTFLRWGYISYDFTIQIERHITFILKIARFLKEKKIKKVIFFTGSPHHVDTLLFQKACKFAGSTQYFLYPSLFERLIILRQKMGIKDWRIIKVKKKRNDLSLRRVNKYIENVKIGGFPTGRKESGTNKNWKMSYLLSIIFVVYFKIRLISRQAIAKNLSSEYSMFSLLKINKDQKSYLKNYRKQCIDKSEIKKYTNSSKPRILIAAHFQPEATSFPEGENYYNHISIIRKLRSLGYKEEIFYKEHPASQNYADRIVGLNRVGLERNNDYLQELKDLGCLFLDINFKISFEKKFVKNFIPITINGSIAIERALMGYSTIYCGNVVWKGMPGTIHIDKIKNLQSTLRQMTKKNAKVKSESKKFMVDLLGNSISNLTGIGTGITMKDKNSIQNFKEEFVTNFCNN